MVAVDTNVLVYAHRGETDFHLKAKELIVHFAQTQQPWAICFHSLVEFYGVVTRRNIWSPPTTPELARECILDWAQIPSLQVLYESDSKSNLSELLDLAVASSISGR